MSSLKTFFLSTLLASAAVATSHDTSNNWGSGGSGGGQYGGSGGGEWSSWGGDKGSPPPAPAPPAPAPASSPPMAMPSWNPSWGEQPSCPSGCFPIPPTCNAPPPPPQQNGQMIVQVVSVADANGSLKYFPNNVQAPVGSIVQFQFHPKNHTITESSFAEPCKPIGANASTETRPGIRSGFIPVKGDENFTPVYNVLINDTKPIWIFCGQTNHCQKGMAMVINQAPDTPNTIEKYIENAAKLPLVNVPPPPPAATGSAPPPPPPAPPAETFTFGGGAPPPPAETGGSPPPPPAPPAGTSAVGAPPAPVATLGTSSAGVAPATFTGAASSLNVRDASYAGVVIGAMAVVLL